MKHPKPAGNTRRSRQIIVIAHNLRSCHNVGSLLRTAEGLGADQVILSGYTPYPLMADDSRLPHISHKINRQISKTALGAENTITWSHQPDLLPVLGQLQADGWIVAAIEQAADSIALPGFDPPAKLALVVGREVEGIEPDILAAVDTILEIPMYGSKESFNVVQAAAMTLYHCRFM
jgi:23S rRNA (guanosine2251-2'-O)-methyltransferase